MNRLTAPGGFLHRERDLLMIQSPEASGGFASSESGSICLFDGRIDNLPDLIDSQNGRLTRTSPPSEVALVLHEQFGVSGLGRIIGDWSLVIANPRAGSIILASDYAGVRPLYYWHANGNIVWSTSLQRMAEYRGAGEISPEFVAVFLARGSACDLSPYPGVLPVPAYHAVTLTPTGIANVPFWSPPLGTDTAALRSTDAEERLSELFRDAVRSRLVAAGSTAACELSGGLDSSSVVCMADRLVREGATPVSRLISITYQQHGSADEKFFRAVEDQCNVEPFYVAAEDCPAAEPGTVGYGSPGWWQQRHELVSGHLRRNGATVILSGQCGDLMMANWLDDSEQVADHLSRGRLSAAAKESLEWSRALRVPVYWLLWRAIQTSLCGNGLGRNMDLSGVTSASAEHGDSLSSKSRKLAIEYEEAQPRHDLRAAPPSARKRLKCLLTLLDSRLLQCPEPLLGFSCTHPYVHRPLVEYMMSVPSHLTCRPGEPRRLMRRAFEGLLPPLVRHRRSKAIYGTAFRSASKRLAAALGNSAEPVQVVERGYVDGVSLRTRLDRFRSGLECNEGQLRQILLLEFWLRANSNRHAPSRISPVNDPANSPRSHAPVQTA
ncbi:MAG: hypothetical protein JNL98_04975 [Bryobacterales bacterium]|nr:hypothetical protein [Bryobacterales bacterium]